MYKPTINESTQEEFCVNCGYGHLCHEEDGTCPTEAQDEALLSLLVDGMTPVQQNSYIYDPEMER